MKSSGTPNHLYVSFHHTFGNLLRLGRSTSWAVSHLGTRGKTIELYRVTTAPLLIRPQKPSAALGGNQPPASMKGGVPNDRIASSSHSKGQVCEIYIYIYIPLLIITRVVRVRAPGSVSHHVTSSSSKLKRGTSRLGGGEKVASLFHSKSRRADQRVPFYGMPYQGTGGPLSHPPNPRLSTAFNKKVFSDRERKTDSGRLRRRTAFRVRAGEAVGA